MTVVQIGSTNPAPTYGQLVGYWPGGWLPDPGTPVGLTFWGYLVIPPGADPTQYDANVDDVDGWDRQLAYSSGSNQASSEQPPAGSLYLVSSSSSEFPAMPAGAVPLAVVDYARFAPAVVPTLRFMSRQVHKTVAQYIEEKLTELGWVNQPVNFGATPITFQEVIPDENGKAVAPNTVAITIGDVSEDIPRELGGGYYEVVAPIFIDVYGSSAATAQSIAEDAKEQISRGMIIPVYNWSTVEPVQTDLRIEFEAAVGPERPPASQQSSDFRKHWRVVKVEAHVFYEPAIG